MEKIFVLNGLDCANCAAKIEREIRTRKGVKKADLVFMTSTLSITVKDDFNGNILEEVKGIVQRLEPDVTVEEKTAAKADDNGKNSMKTELLQIIIGAVIFIAAVLPWMPEPAKTVLYFGAYALLGCGVIWKALKNISRGRVFDENFLMAFASAGALVIGEYPEAVAVMLFYLVGEYFQKLAVGKSKKSISALMNIRPDYANLKTAEGYEKVSPDRVVEGDIIIVKPGEKIPLDGIVEEGSSTLDTAALTGESVPRSVETGGKVLSGSVNLTGALEIKVTKTYGESTASKIIGLVENAASKKAKTESFITVFAKYYTPAVVGMAALLFAVPTLFLGGAWEEWLHRSLVFLVISCPCALVISIPLSYFAGIGGMSRNGVLVKGGNYLDALARAEIVVFDKTGTLTKGVFKVTGIEAGDGFTNDEILMYAAHAEALSNHPIAMSVVEAYGKSPDTAAVSGFEELSGHGVSAVFSGKRVLAGGKRLLEQNAVAAGNGFAEGTVVYVAVDGVYAGRILVSDEVKNDAVQTIEGLKERRVSKTVMLTGDSKAIGESVGKNLGIDEVFSELLPADKVEIVERLENNKQSNGTLIFVGDGINDTPALARADVGVAMGGLGQDAAIEAADVVIMTDEPSRLLTALDMSKATRRIVMQNIIFALGAKAAMLLLGALGVAGMWGAVFADVGVSIIVILNAMRILREKSSSAHKHSHGRGNESVEML